jgi:hypothetical protein
VGKLAVVAALLAIQLNPNAISAQLDQVVVQVRNNETAVRGTLQHIKWVV